MFRTSYLLLAVLVAGATLGAAQPGARERVIYASVLDAQGEPVSGLGPNDFIVREDGARREVLRVSPAVEPIAIALLVDNSAAASEDIRNIREGVTAFLAAMGGENDIAIVGLADRPTILQEYTRNAELLKRAVGRLFAQPGSGMVLLEALVEVSRGLARREEPRAAIVAVLTEGTEFSELHYDTVLDALDAGGAGMYAVTIGAFTASMAGPLRNRAVVLDQGPRRTGGRRETIVSSMGVKSALEQLARDLANQYKVVYGRPESLIPPEGVTVAVTRPGLTARGTPERRRPGA